ncbi:MAG: transcriptional regulator BetI, partial [Microvirga sp.]
MADTALDPRDVEFLRREQLIRATIDSIADVGFAACTLGDIARRAGVSPGLFAHYFGDKEGLLEATLRSMAARLGRAAAARLRAARRPRDRIQAVIDANLAPEEFDRRTSSVWLAFWGQVIHSARFRRIQNIYQRRMLSNLRHALKQLVAVDEAESIAIGVSAMIDGLWLRATLSGDFELDSRRARSLATAFVDMQLQFVQRKSAMTSAAASAATIPRVCSHIGGQSVDRAQARTFLSINPATGEPLARIEIAGEAEVEQAVSAARSGQAVWQSMTGAERGRILRRVADRLRERNAELARLETLDTGKPIQETSAVDVLSGADCIEYFAGLAPTLTGEHVDLGPTAFGYTRREPLGIVAGIGAWNYPLQIACWKAAPALACGNAMIFKPAELTPLTAPLLAEAFAEAGLPAGVFNVVQGDARVGRALV